MKENPEANVGAEPENAPSPAGSSAGEAGYTATREGEGFRDAMWEARRVVESPWFGVGYLLVVSVALLVMLYLVADLLLG